MVTLLPPDLSTSFLAALLVPLIIGFLVGLIAKGLLKVGLAIAALIIVLIALGMLSPNQVLGPVLALVRSGESYSGQLTRISGYLPYSSLTFVLGLVVGFFRG
ncbi:MAG: hypothetical protein LYZ70_07440 [Nitrososphaerales archaeon]|nr:hypothetical protein [Nitrososphaerales archaeon]